MRIAILFLLLLVASACSPKQGTQRAAYYWKTTVSFSPKDSLLLRTIASSKWYVRYFDVDMVNGEPRPVAPVQHPERIPSDRPLIPVVYITFDVLKSLNDSTSAVLASRITSMVTRMHEKTDRPLTELQIDCDWTESTQKQYFAFLRNIRSYIGTTALSATIRLHQIRSPQVSGIPPIDRGMLMFYNMGHPGKTGEKNAIIDNEIIHSYTKNLHAYPLPLDYAFPIFSWGVLLRNGHLVGLIRDITESDLNSHRFLRRKSSSMWIANSSGAIGSVVIKSGDKIRLDQSSPKSVLRAAKIAARQDKHDSTTTISFFSWNSEQIKPYHPNNILRLYETFQ